MKKVEIKDYLLIGDLHTSALISNKGSIDWLCLPHFDSPSIFGAILDNYKGGSFSIELNGYKSTSKYIKDTAIVETIFTNKNKSFFIKDFMLPLPIIKTNSHFLVRKFKSLNGKHNLRFIFDPRPNYSLDLVNVEIEKDRLKIKLDEGLIILHLPAGTKIETIGTKLVLDVALNENQLKEFVLEFYHGRRRKYKKTNLEFKTNKFWKNWITKGKFFDFCRNNLIRSAITLKLMQYFPTGALIASPTTSLPESIGGERNWDYRFVWIRDATFTLFAFYALGFIEEATKFFKYIETTAKECEECRLNIQLINTINGKKPMKEKRLNHLSGYKNSRPVRIGNDAINQFQLDVYGALIDSYYFMLKRGLRVTKSSKEIILHLVDRIEKNWKRKDNSIWEFRHKSDNYTYSKVMAWVGVNRVLRLCSRLKIKKKTRKRLEDLEINIREWIWKNCFDNKKEIIKQASSKSLQDSTNLLFIPLQFLDRHKPISKVIIENTRKELAKDKLRIYRYKSKDGLESKEGTFNLCSFWLISALAMTGEINEAKKLFHKSEKEFMSNGLMSEETDPNTNEFLGNYPQAFSHMGYIMAAYYINKYEN